MGYLVNNYNRFPFTFVRGDGCYLYDSSGDKYLDFTSGISVVNLGHSNRDLANIICEQSKKLIHTSNLFLNKEQEELAGLLFKHTNEGLAFFCNSGAEANEAAIKLARIYGNRKYDGLRYKIITMENSFHGRSYATLSATGQKKIWDGFEPIANFFYHIPFNDFDAFYEATKKNDVVAVMLELIQGEGGVVEANKGYIERLVNYCNKEDIIVIIDEVQTGIGRTGEFICSNYYNIKPDIITLAKSLGNGLPIGAMIAKKEYADYFKPGSHGSTFGGNHLVCKVASEVVKKVSKDTFLADVRMKGVYLKRGLEKLFSKYGAIRGMGFMLGVYLNDINANELASTCMSKGLLLIPTSGNTIRIYPPLNVCNDDIDKALDILDKSLRGFI
ncbi:MAG: aspartate aminotransferase family protein [Deferribacterota bacterium]|nr:aspartate aminotransferase family protein [Deferribacterota bacterium]